MKVEIKRPSMGESDDAFFDDEGALWVKSDDNGMGEYWVILDDTGSVYVGEGEPDQSDTGPRTPVDRKRIKITVEIE